MFWKGHDLHVITKLIVAMIKREKVQPVELSARDQRTPNLYLEAETGRENLRSHMWSRTFQTRKPEILVYVFT